MLIFCALVALSSHPAPKPRECNDLAAIVVDDLWTDTASANEEEQGFRVVVARWWRSAPHFDRRVYQVDQTFALRLHREVRCHAQLLRKVRDAVADISFNDDLLLRLRKTLLASWAHDVPYRVEEHASLTPTLEQRFQAIALRFYRKTRKPLTITSASRTPFSQAQAMYTKLSLGSRLLRLYRARAAAGAIVASYRQGRKARQPRREVVAAMEQTIRQQMRKGTFISDHLRGDALDVRSYGLRRREVRTFVQLAQQSAGVWAKVERRPPHIHLAFRATATRRSAGQPIAGRSKARAPGGAPQRIEKASSHDNPLATPGSASGPQGVTPDKPAIQKL